MAQAMITAAVSYCTICGKQYRLMVRRCFGADGPETVISPLVGEEPRVLRLTRCTDCPYVFMLTVTHKDGEHRCTAVPIQKEADNINEGIPMEVEAPAPLILRLRHGAGEYFYNISAGEEVGEEVEVEEEEDMEVHQELRVVLQDCVEGDMRDRTDNDNNNNDNNDIDTFERNNDSGNDSPLGTIPTPNSAPTSDCESEIRFRRTLATHQIIDSEDSASGGETDDGDIVVLSGGCVTQEARLVGRQAGGAGAANRLPSSTSPESRYERMVQREKRGAGPTEQLPVGYSTDDRHIMTALGSHGNNLRIYTLATRNILACARGMTRYALMIQPRVLTKAGIRLRHMDPEVEHEAGMVPSVV